MEQIKKIYVSGSELFPELPYEILKDAGGISYNYLNNYNNTSMIYYINPQGYICCADKGSPIADIIEDNYKEIKLPTTKFKDGDFVISNDGKNIGVFKKYLNLYPIDLSSFETYFLVNLQSNNETNNIEFNDNTFGLSTNYFRKATQQEEDKLNILLRESHNLKWKKSFKRFEAYRWKPTIDEPYYYISDDGNICKTVYKGCCDTVDERRWKFGNCFNTIDKAMYKQSKIKETMLKIQ